MSSDYHTPHASGAPLTSAEVNAPLGELDAALGKIDVTLSAKAYGVVADGATDDYAALTAAIAALPTAGGTIILPRGTVVLQTALDLSAKRGIKLKGQGGLSPSASVGTTILYKATGSGSIINMQSAYGVSLEDVAIQYDNAGFTGRVVDVRNVASTDPSYNTLTRCGIGGTGGANGAVVGVDLDKTTRFAMRDCLVHDVQVGAQGKSVNANYSNQVLIENCTFRDNVLSNIRNPDEAWTILSCESNPLTNGRGIFMDYGASVRGSGITVMGCWMGDVTDVINAHAQISILADGIVVEGNMIGGGTVTTGIAIGATSTNIREGGNYFSTGLGTKMSPRLHSIYLDAHDAALDGSTLSNIGAAPDSYPAVVLTDGATQGAFWTFKVPENWSGGPLAIIPVWVPASTDGTAHTVQWSMDVVERADANLSMGAGGTTTAFTGASAARTAGRLIYDTETSTGVTPTGIGNIIRLNLRRVGADAADTYVGNVNLVGVIVKY